MQKKMNNVLERLGIDAECINAEVHRHLAFFDIKLGDKTPVKKLENHSREIAIHLESETVPIIKVIPKLGVVRMQVALSAAKIVYFLDLVANEELPNKVLPILLGEDDSGKKLWMDMNDNPHLIVAGATGSGKSSLLQVLIANALLNHALRFRNVWIYLSDPKRVEFNEYKDEALSESIKTVASSYDETVAMLKEIYNKMETRYKIMHNSKMRSVEEDPQFFPVIFCIIDEVSDLMMQDKKNGELQNLLVKIAQKGRAAGVFLTLATQRPSVDVITGLIKANFPGRIACKTASRKDSEVVLDRPGAETLLGRGDAVMQNMKFDSVRFQVSFITPEDTIDMFKTIKAMKKGAA